MAVAVDEVGDVAGFVLPRARVDVLVSLSQSAENAVARVVLQNVEVLAVAQEIEGKKDEPQVVKVVTLLVTPDEAERLALAGHQGTLRLALRNYTDDKIVFTSGSDTQAMLRGYGSAQLPTVTSIQGPSPLASARNPTVAPTQVEIMRDGARSELVSFVKGSRLRPAAREGEGASAVAGTGVPGAGIPDAGVPGAQSQSQSSGEGEMRVPVESGPAGSGNSKGVYGP